MAKNQNNNTVAPATKKTEPEAKKDALAVRRPDTGSVRISEASISTTMPSRRSEVERARPPASRTWAALSS